MIKRYVGGKYNTNITYYKKWFTINAVIMGVIELHSFLGGNFNFHSTNFQKV